MDINGTKFHLLLGEDDWKKCSIYASPLCPEMSPAASPPGEIPSNLFWDQDRAEISLRPRTFLFVQDKSNSALTTDDRRGAACDRFGNWYWIDGTEFEILVQSAGTLRTSHFWSAGDGLECAESRNAGDFVPAEPAEPPKKLQLRGLTVTEDHYLVVGSLDPAGLLIFDLFSGGPPRHMLWPQCPFEPFDMSSRPAGGLWILDRTHRSLWALDRHLNVVDFVREERTEPDEKEEVFQPSDGRTKRRTMRKTPQSSISLEIGSPVDNVDPVAVEALPDGSVLVLESSSQKAFSNICRYSFQGKRQDDVSLDGILEKIGDARKKDFTLIAHDFAFVAEHKDPKGGTVTDRIYAVEEKGNQAFVLDIRQEEGKLKISPLTGFFPMREYGGKGLVTSGTKPNYDFNNRWIPLIEQKRPCYDEEAEFYTPCFDGGAPDCVWHRLMLDALVPPQTKVRVWSRVANDRKSLESAAWYQEPDPYKRGDGPELPFYRNTNGRDTWELLFQKAKGRYLQLKVELSGNGRLTPRIHALRVHYPRFSYLDHYLPSLYREDRDSASFLDRFLSNTEGFFTAIEDKIAAAQMLFDVRSAPAEALEWLAEWLGIALDPAWESEEKRRLFIKHAMDFFQYRGTIRGLQIALRLALDECANEDLFAEQSQAKGTSPIRIIEEFRKRRTPAVVLGDPTEYSGPRRVSVEHQWNPKLGGDDLHRRYSEFLQKKNLTTIRFPIRAPDCDEVCRKWREFAIRTVGAIPGVGTRDQKRWQDFLALRYINITELNAAYQTKYPSFADVSEPGELPPDGPALVDWYVFQSKVLPMHTYAHRFTVMLPMPKGEMPYSEEHTKRIGLADRIVKLEKPAHTTFEIKFYWNMFRVGEVRLGYDTALDLSSRMAGLMTPMILGRRPIGESHIGFTPAQEAGRRTPGCGPLDNRSAFINRENDYEHICRQ
jgi:phage tail-like protein